MLRSHIHWHSPSTHLTVITSHTLSAGCLLSNESLSQRLSCGQGLLEPRYVALALPLCETAEAVEAACTTIARTNASVGDAVVAAALVEAWARIGRQDALVQTVRGPSSLAFFCRALLPACFCVSSPCHLCSRTRLLSSLELSSCCYLHGICCWLSAS